jgi:uncharacterized membrane protein YgaE (UPF0421/DUF939 family)
MNTLIHADVFFFVSTIVFTIIGLGIAIALFYVIKILRTLNDVSKKVKEESDGIIADVHALRGSIKSEGFKMKYAVSFMKALFGRRKAKARKEKDGSEE